MTALMRRLETRGLLRRESDPGDERVWKVRISGKGRQMLRRVEGTYYRKIDRIMQVHSEKDLERLSEQLCRTQEAVSREAVHEA